MRATGLSRPYCAMIRLGMPIPDTWLLPPKEYTDQPDLQKTLERYAEYFELEPIGDELGYPSYLKPYDGGGWVGVTRIENEARLRSRSTVRASPTKR